MPTRILHKEVLIPGKTSKLVLDAPQIARKAQPGHFVMLRVCATGESIPLTVADANPQDGTITIVYLVMGKSTSMLDTLGQGDHIHDVCGPLAIPPTLNSVARWSAWAAARALPPCTTLPRAMLVPEIAWWPLSVPAARIYCSLSRNCA